jgi:hypothetical protein
MTRPLTPAEAVSAAKATSTLANFGVPAGGRRGGILQPKTTSKFRVLFGDVTDPEDFTIRFSYKSMDHQLFNPEWDTQYPEDIDLETAKKMLKKLLAEKEARKV